MSKNRWIVTGLLGVLGLLQAELWLGDSGIGDHRRAQVALQAAQAEVEALKAENEKLVSLVQASEQYPNAAIEARARSALGMIREGERFLRLPTDQAGMALPQPVPAVSTEPSNGNP